MEAAARGRKNTLKAAQKEGKGIENAL